VSYTKYYFLKKTEIFKLLKKDFKNLACSLCSLDNPIYSLRISLHPVHPKRNKTGVVKRQTAERLDRTFKLESATLN